MTMGGGCHGCSMSRMTMLDGVQTMLSEPSRRSGGEGPHRPHHRRKPLLQLTVSPSPLARAVRTAAAMPAWSRPRRREDLLGRAGVGDEPGRQAERPWSRRPVTARRRAPRSSIRSRRRRTPSSTVIDRSMLGGVGEHHRVERGAAPGVPHRDVDPGLGELGGGAFGGGDELADGDDAGRPRPDRRPDGSGGRRVRTRPRARPPGGRGHAGSGWRPGRRRRARRRRPSSPAAPGRSTGRAPASPAPCASIARSYTPWWLGPSGPVIPARSMQNTTGRRCRATS